MSIVEQPLDSRENIVQFKHIEGQEYQDHLEQKTKQQCKQQHTLGAVDTIDEDSANYRIGKMYLDAGKWKDAFPFLVKAANKYHNDATIAVIQNYSLYNWKSPEKSELLEFVKDQKRFLKSNSGPVSHYFLAKVRQVLKRINYADSPMYILYRSGSFILSKYEYALFLYKRYQYHLAEIEYKKITERFDFMYLSQDERGEIYNDLSLCGYWTSNKDIFAKYNALALHEDCAIAFNNRANAFLYGKLLCSEPDYNSAKFWFEQALERFVLSQVQQIKYATERVELCKKELSKNQRE